MLKPPSQLPAECQKFQRLYEGGAGHEHPKTCDECRRFVEFVDGLRRLGMSTPLEDDLRARLRGLPAREDGLPAFPPVPQLPLPAALAERLRRIARQGAQELPIWIRSPRYAIAASYLLTILIGATLGNPAAWASSAGGRIETVGSALQQVRVSGKERWDGVEERAAENYHLTRDYLRASTTSLRARWNEFVAGMNEPDTTDAGDDDDTETPTQGEDL